MADDSAQKPPQNQAPAAPPVAGADTPGSQPAAPTVATSGTGPPAPAAPAASTPTAPAPKPAAVSPTPAVTAAKPAAAPRPAPAAKPAAEHAPKAAAPSGPTEPPPPADKTPPAFIAALSAAIPGSVSLVSYWVGDWTIVVPVALLLDVVRHLRDAAGAGFDYLSDLTATDWPPRAEGRFDVIYCLYSTPHRHRVRVKVKVGEFQPVPSVTGVWPAANWLEREVWDMFGVNFTGHPDRRRLLMPEDWQGFPQRKDYPLEGPGELLMENPEDWLKLRQAKEEADIE